MRFRTPLIILALLTLSGCAETELVSHVAKQVPLPGESRSQGLFKVGSPYRVSGKLYTPRETYRYKETGIASWYGPGFHGRKTANGEIFDMNELTAAHKTLQMPSIVRVTNLENGRSLVVRVNDRGPFKRGRVIDVSRRAAELLGFKGQGVAKVKLELLPDESRQIAEAAKRGEDTRGVEVAMNNQPRRPPPQRLPREDFVPGHIENGNFYPDPVVKKIPVPPTNIYVQAGSFTNEGNAVILAENLSGFAPSRVDAASINGRRFYRVRLGPVQTVRDADALLSRLVSSGHKDAITVVE